MSRGYGSSQLAIEDLPSRLHQLDWVINHQLYLPGRSAAYEEFADLGLAAPATEFVRCRYPQGMYSHQRNGLRAFLDGHNLCMATGTASGKSLVFHVAIIHLLATAPTARTLAVFPLKALGHEQEERLNQALALANLKARVARIDGQVPVHLRLPMVREANIVIATPDIVHAWLLPTVGEPTVRAFLANLKLVIVDEVHNYTGVFGSNACFLFRRLEHIVQTLGGRFTYICASATLDNPGEHLALLFGHHFRVLGPDTDSSPRQPCNIVLTTPPPTVDLLRSLTQLFSEVAKSSAQCFLAFADSRKQVEHLTAILRRENDAVNDPADAQNLWGEHLERLNILPFRAGYELEDRDKILKRLTTGTLKGVISTSALELGIDIPYVDVGILVGVPPSQTSLVQRIGRVGRHRPGWIFVVNRGTSATSKFSSSPTNFSTSHQRAAPCTSAINGFSTFTSFAWHGTAASTTVPWASQGQRKRTSTLHVIGRQVFLICAARRD